LGKGESELIIGKLNLFIIDFFEHIRDFLEAGGYVLWVILGVTFILWTLIIERYFYILFLYPKQAKQVIQNWNQRKVTSFKSENNIRKTILSQESLKLKQFIPFIKSLVMIAPLLGLLGTVTGMIAVFDVMALLGTGNARMMSSGISMATIPTMAGMVTALTGLYFGSHLEHLSAKKVRVLKDFLLLKTAG